MFLSLPCFILYSFKLTLFILTHLSNDSLFIIASALKSLLIILSHYSNHINLSSSTLLLIPERTYLNPRLTSISSSNFNLTLKLILNPSHNPPFRRFTTIINLSFFSLHLCILLIIAHIYILITINFNKILGEPHL